MSAAPLNILFITSDQQHWDTLGFLNPRIHTPHLDRLAVEGMNFSRAYCTNPTCTPSRASMITGLYPSQHGAWSLGTKLPESVHTVGEDFDSAGYFTALVGKAHFQPLKSTPEYPSLESYPIMQDLDFWRGFHGPFYGFRHVELARNHVDEAHVGQHYAIWMEEKGFTSWRDHFHKPTGKTDGQKHRWTIPEEYHYNAWIAERTNALMADCAAQGRNFFLWASFFDPHPPYLVPEPWDTMYDPSSIAVPRAAEGEHEDSPPHIQMTQTERPDFSSYREPDGNGMHGFHSHLCDAEALAADIAVYYGMVSCMDKYIGVILEKLDALGLAKNTLVVFTTDHGHFYGQHGLKAKGAFHYEDMIRLPMIVRLPDRIPAGGTCSALQSQVDLPVTFLRYAGIDVPRIMVGVDQTAAWEGGPAARTHAVVENRHQPTTIHVKTYVDERYKITVYWNREYGEIYDLQEDPGEIHNLWDSLDHARLKAELVMKLLFAEMGKEPLWMPRISGA
ncbi:MAG: sulfatase-like hydrolase/transferase [Planctomycetes bacterium]|nr:sulfatase-like hydrolase/transferase [Planctomycetota bacterium]